jgi:hypothetical protein
MEVDEAWEVLNLSVTSGYFKPATVRLPLVGAAWDEDHVVYDEVTSGAAFKRQVPPVAAASRPVNARTAVWIPGARLAGAVVDVSSRRASELLFSRRGGMFRLSTGQIAFQGMEMRMTAQTDTLVPYRSEGELLAAAREALAATRQLTGEERLAVTMAVNEHRLEMSGNVLTPRSRQTLVQAVAHAVSPMPLSESITDDLTLESTVARALQRSGIARSASLHPRSRLGVVTLYGSASLGAAAEAERVTTRVPGVRQVDNRIEIVAAPGHRSG